MPSLRSDVRTALAGLTVGGLVIAALASGSGVLALLASLVAIAVSLVSPLTGIVALALLAPVARPLVIPPPGLYVAMVAAMLFGVILRLPVERPRLRPPAPEVILFGAFLVYVATQFLGGYVTGYSADPEIASLFARLVEAVATFGIAYIVLRGRSPYPVLTALLVAAAIVSLLALSQVLDAEAAIIGLMDPIGPSGRISGVFGNPNYFGAYLAGMLVLTLACLVEVRSIPVRLVLLSLGALVSVTLVLSQSRGALVAGMAGVITVAFVRSRKLGVLTVMASILAVAIAYPVFSAWRFGEDDAATAGNLTTAAGRTEAWSGGIESFISSPVFGIGLGRFGDESPGGISPHNWYVQVLAELGIVGFILWMSFVVAAVMALRRRPRPARTVGFSVLAVWLVAGMTMGPPQEFRFTGAVLIAVAAAVVALWPSGEGGSQVVARADMPLRRLPPRAPSSRPLQPPPAAH